MKAKKKNDGLDGLAAVADLKSIEESMSHRYRPKPYNMAYQPLSNGAFFPFGAFALPKDGTPILAV